MFEKTVTSWQLKREWYIDQWNGIERPEKKEKKKLLTYDHLQQMNQKHIIGKEQSLQ